MKFCKLGLDIYVV